MKAYLKNIAHLGALLVALPFAILERALRLTGSNEAFSALSQLLSLVPGRVGSYLRVAYYRLTLTECESDLFIGFGTIFSQRNTKLAKGSYIGPQCNIGACSIGADTLIASGVHILSGTGQHRFDDLETPIRDQGGVFEPISIGVDCWVGNGAIVLADVGDHAIVGAGSIVTRQVPAYAIVAGNPAKVLRSRLPENCNQKSDAEPEQGSPSRVTKD